MVILALYMSQLYKIVTKYFIGLTIYTFIVDLFIAMIMHHNYSVFGYSQGYHADSSLKIGATDTSSEFCIR